MNEIAVGFDFDHTLGLDHSLERRALGMLAEELGSPIDVEAPAEAAIIEHALGPFRRAETSMEQMLDLFVSRLPPRTRHLDYGPAELADRFRDHCFRLVDELVEPIAGARATIAALVAEGVPVGILTNGWSPLQEKKIARALDVFPGPVLVSDVIGAYKPSTIAFAKLARALDCKETNVWYVGDNPAADVAGARAHGLRTVWFNYDGHSFPEDIAPPDAQISRLDDVLRVVRGT